MSSCELCVHQNCSNQTRSTFCSAIWLGLRNWMSSFVTCFQSGRFVRSSEKQEFREPTKPINELRKNEARQVHFSDETAHVSRNLTKCIYCIILASVLHLLYICFDFSQFIVLLWFHSHLLPAEWISLENQRRKWATSAQESKKSPWGTFSQSWTCVCASGEERRGDSQCFMITDEKRWDHTIWSDLI